MLCDLWVFCGFMLKTFITFAPILMMVKNAQDYELEQQILSFGENMKVLEPVELKERIKKRLGGAILNYVEKVQNR